MSKIRYSFCASHVDAINDANDVNFHVIDIEEGNFSNSEETTSDSDNDDNAGLLSNSNDDTSEHEDSLAEEENDLLAVHTRRTETNKGESAEGIMLARESVVCSCRNPLLTRWNSKNGTLIRMEDQMIFFLIYGDLVLLSTAYITKH